MQTILEDLKRCSKCGIEKSVTDFYVDKRRQSGLFSACKLCHNILSRRWASVNKERKHETNRLWQLANVEKRRAAFLRRYARTDVVVPATKLCSACGLQLGASEFHKRKDAADGLYPLCKSCRSKADKELRKNNIERYREFDRVRYHTDPKRRNRTDWYLANKEKSLKKSAAYAIANPEIVRAAKRKHVALHGHYSRRLERAFVSWANKEKIIAFFVDRDQKTRETGILHQVDHIVPIKSKIVCGLHNEFNLQIITKSKNLSKGNRTWPDMP